MVIIMCVITDENGIPLTKEEEEIFLKSIYEKLETENQQFSCDYGMFILINENNK